MSAQQRQYLLYIEDILTSMRRIQDYIGTLTFIEFKKNMMVVDAVIRNFEIIGEASKNIPFDIKARNPELPWDKMYGLRNLISHAYFGIDYDMIWEIATTNLPQNIADIELVLQKEIQLFAQEE